MSGRAWTPGPWKIGVSADHTPLVMVDVHPSEGSGFGVAHINRLPRMGSVRGDVAANARLIAAAPELFEALNSLAGSVGGLEIAEEAIRAAIGNTNWSVLQTHLDAARAALSKATDDGRQT